MSAGSSQVQALVPILNQIMAECGVKAGTSQTLIAQFIAALGNCDNPTTQNGPTNLNGPVTMNGPITINNPDGTMGFDDLAILSQELTAGSSAQAQGLVNSQLQVRDFFLKVTNSTATYPENTPIAVMMLASGDGGPPTPYCATPPIPEPDGGAALVTLNGGQTLVANGTANAVTLGGTSIVINEPGLLPSGLAIQANWIFPAFEEKGVWYSVYRPRTLPGVLSGDLASGGSAAMALTSTYLTGSITVRGDYVRSGKKLATGDLVVSFFIDGNGVYQALADKNCATAYVG